MTKSREVHLVSRPHGLPLEENFALVSVALPPLKQGQILVKNLWMSVDPAMRPMMRESQPGGSYVEPYALGEVMAGEAIGQVLESSHPDYRVGSYLRHFRGFREYFVADGSESDLLPVSPAIGKSSDEVPLQGFLGVLGMTGVTAYMGMMLVAGIQAGETVYVSGAAGAVGSTACQIARINGCRVIGSAGSDEKLAWLKNELGIDAGINYKGKTAAELEAEIAKASPEGIDVYFENVGGPQLEALLNLMNPRGRIVMCGLISQYNDAVPSPGPSNLINIITKSLTVRGFIGDDFEEQEVAIAEQLREWVADGKLKSRQTVVTGIDKVPAALNKLFTGGNIGKMLVKLAEPERV